MFGFYSNICKSHDILIVCGGLGIDREQQKSGEMADYYESEETPNGGEDKVSP